MRGSRLLRLALGEAGASPWRAWPLAAGLGLGVACLVFLLGFAASAEVIMRERVLGSLPDRVRVRPSVFQMGPVQMDTGMTADTMEQLLALPGVVDVYRQAHYPEPCQLYASYGGRHLVTDLVLEGVDPGQVEHEVPRGRTFAPPAPGEDVPAIVPRALLDIVNAGISVNTDLPNLSPDALIGKHFTLRLGTSSFSRGAYVEKRCVIVAVSDQIGVGGPAVPYESLAEWTQRPLVPHTLTVRVARPELMGDVVAAIHEMGLETPGLETAQRLSGALQWARIGVTVFCGAILLVAGVGLSSGLSLQVREEARFIGLYRAVGASRRDVLRIYLARAGALGLAGSALGLVSGVVVGWACNVAADALLPQGFLGQHGIFTVTWPAVVGGMLFGLSVSLLSGFLPARAAADLRPAETLRAG